ncbi:ABC transporter ATP-binding protein [Vibrio sp. TH_r3]|uniref:ABC transporter ATP-binding protein n=1 Tax=Vibrio sp. TH_r3 TaxID=3082084 RepID=UPI0029533495|nr:ABC transporter ATP-binding protein [Vibrio sp. TH_r3]MDV7104205.1 ABC transporter ATP-binding protein [Vibrio sp. TH_r3]
MGKVVVSNVGKAFKTYPTKWSRLIEWINPFSGTKHKLNWVLQDISFELEQGEAVGIIGINGAGKSTLLKMITGTSAPTIGSISLDGRVAALLELGMGFHPDFTGRENAYMAGQLLGLSKEELDKLMPEIIDFSEIGEYIDQPTRVYSSGMQMRLAFSVATAIRPDILIVDEALSVGDTHFQHKSFGRIRKFRELGTTLLIVSHDKQAIQSICDKAILLNSGKVELIDKPEVVMDYYNAMIANKQGNEENKIQQDDYIELGGKTISGTGEVTFKKVFLLDENRNKIDSVTVNQNVILSIEIEKKADCPDFSVGYLVKDRLGLHIFGINSKALKEDISLLSISNSCVVEFSFKASLGVGTYSIAVALHSGEDHMSRNYEWRDRECIFNVINKDTVDFIGCNYMLPKVEVKYEV